MSEVITEMRQILTSFFGPHGLTSKVNEELRLIRKKSTGNDPLAEKRMKEIEEIIADGSTGELRNEGRFVSRK